MASTSIDLSAYSDPILSLAKDKDLIKDNQKTQTLVLLIKDFSITERKVSRLCQLSLTILQTLEKIELNLKNWAFFSLNLNSADHFDPENTDDIKEFNNSVSLKVINSCRDLTTKLNKISSDVDFITTALRSLSPIEFISDSGTLLTSLTLRNIKLKDELRDGVKIAYLRAKLITIGTDLEAMLANGSIEEQQTVGTYKKFVVSLMKQLNDALESDDIEDRNECLAVISDMEQMFEAYKLEKAQTTESEEATKTSPTGTSYSDQTEVPLYEYSAYNKAAYYSDSEESTRRGSTSTASTGALHRSVLGDELPHLLSAFHPETPARSEPSLPVSEKSIQSKKREEETHDENLASSSILRFPRVKNHLPDSSLYSGSEFISRSPLPTASSYLNANNSWLSKLGIRPQVITTDIPEHKLAARQRQLPAVDREVDEEDKENRPLEDQQLTPLTRQNLETHTLSLLSQDSLHQDDDVE